ncbi:NAD/NADP octopine/nopaline dehydrogenase family protein [Cytobacillus firmus]|uniref:NAD/NADP octopine/nopaline dehydrogenase family protein n=1 Tax=Cytobacillus firmus TaxID=1399 RepID=A0AA46SHC9_CYTFI|nr:NAD/NADP-dependent octopine/nopaline dehydrogenase family protein [Cytobacillus firmus]UYG98106.1 NAD/NADP octopine/nopaline dehydrogenase family protein [Cytobacillus firmus]
MKRTVAVLGGGNGGHTLAADLSLAGHEVRLFEMEKFSHSMKEVFETKRIQCFGEALNGTAEISLVTSDIDQAIADAEIILIAVPAFAHKEYANLLANKVKPDQLVALLPGTLGSLEFAKIWRELGVDENIVLAESDTLPYATRLEGPGKVRVNVKIKVQIGVFPSVHTKWATSLLNDILDITPVSNVLEAGLSSMNPIDHPPGTILNAGRIEKSNGEFYIYEEGMTPSVIRVMERLDQERLAIGKGFGMKLMTIAELLHTSGYGPKGTTWEVLNGSRSLTPIKGPTSLKSRYLSEDIPFGLRTFASIADHIGLETPVMDSLITLGEILVGGNPQTEGRTIKDLGISEFSKEEIIEFICTGNHKVSV